MKVLVDTNVLISAAFRDRLPEKVILFLSSRPDFVWIATEEIMKEYRDVLRRKKFKLTHSVIEKWEQVFEEMILVVPSSSILSFPRDQKDAKFLSCALDAGADFLITGDKDFSEAKKLTKTTILSAAKQHNSELIAPPGLSKQWGPLQRTLLLFVIMFFWFLPLAQAEIKTFLHTVRQPFSGSQSPDDARTAAIHKAKREVLEKAGTYLETLTIVEDGRLTKDQILALASGVLKTEIISQKPYTTGEGYGVIIKVRVEVDTGQVEKSLKRLMNNKKAMKNLVELRKRDKELLDRIERLEKVSQSITKKEETPIIKQKKKELKKDFRQTTRGLNAVALVNQTHNLWKDGIYVAYANGIVKDTNTGLEWKVGPDRDTNWDEARSWVQSLGGGWRMPTTNELEGLYKKATGSRNMTPLLKTTGWWVWSGETKGSSQARYFTFNYGLKHWDHFAYSITMRVFAVRSQGDG